MMPRSFVRNVLGFVVALHSAATGGLLDENDPLLKNLARDIVFHVSFDDGSADADLAVGDPQAAILGEPLFVPGAHGQAVRNVNLRYMTEKNLHLDRPGSLSIWVCPLPPGQPVAQGLVAPLFMTDYKGDGYLGFERGEPIVRDEKLVTHTLRSWAHYFKNLANQSSTIHVPWQENQWHLLVITWRGPRWQVFVDGTCVSDGALPRAIRQDEIHVRFMIGSATAAIDEVTVYRRPLGEEEMKKICELQRRQGK